MKLLFGNIQILNSFISGLADGVYCILEDGSDCVYGESHTLENAKNRLDEVLIEFSNYRQQSYSTH